MKEDRDAVLKAWAARPCSRPYDTETAHLCRIGGGRGDYVERGGSWVCLAHFIKPMRTR